MYSSASLLLSGDNSLVEILRCLTSIELFLHPEFYGKHSCFDLAFKSQKNTKRSLNHFFRLSLKNATLDHCANDNLGAVKNEAILNCKNFEWCSFMCLLGLSSVLKGQIFSFFPKFGDTDHRNLFNSHIKPRVTNVQQKCFKILFCRNEVFGDYARSGSFQANHFVPLIPVIRKRKSQSCSSKSSTASKKICLNLPKMEGIASRLNKDMKQSKLKFKPCKLQTSQILEPNFSSCSTTVSSMCSSNCPLTTISCSSNSTLISPSSLPSSTSTSTSDNSLKSSDLVLSVKLDSNKQSNSDVARQKCKYKNDVSTFFSLRSPNDLSNNEKDALLKNVFRPDKNFVFPKNNGRPFLHVWLSQYDWLCYSPACEGAYCIYCVLFSDKVVTKETQLVHLPYKTWRDAHGGFRRHVNAEAGIHSKSMKNYGNFLKEMAGQVAPVNVQVVQTTTQTKKNAKILISIIDTIKTVARMGIALRGHRDDSQYLPEVEEPATHGGVGNFVEMINYAVRHGDNDLKDHLENCSSRETYISKTTQNKLLNCCYDLMSESIITKVKKAKFFALICDEAGDTSNKEQLSLCLRYVDESGDICEDFLKYINCQSGLTGEVLYQEVSDALESFNLDKQFCRGQGYDGAGAVAGSVNGLAQRFLNDNPKALWTHCRGHRLNLAIWSSVGIVSVRNLMDTIQNVTYFFKFSPIRNDHLTGFITGTHKKLKQLEEEENKDQTEDKYEKQTDGQDKKKKGQVKTKLHDPCRTRWVERIHGLNIFEDEFYAIVQTLEYFFIDKEVNADTISKSLPLWQHLCKFPFIITLVVVRKVFDFTHSVTTLLQGESIDIVAGFDLITSLIDVFVNTRNNIDHLFEEWYSHALEIARKVGIEESKPRLCSRQKNRENYETESTADYYRVSLAIPLVELVESELKRRFQGDQGIVFDGLYIIPHIMISNPNWKDHFKKFLNFYKDDFEEVSLSSIDGELALWEQYWKNSMASLPDSVSATLKKINFPSFKIIKTALRILGTIPVTSCACERSFSAMKILKTYNRSTMTNDRLNALAMLYVHKDIHPTSEDVLRKYKAMGSHRLEFEV